MFQFAGFASQPYEFRLGYRLRGGFPHSEILGSKPARSSPGLIATCYVLHRLSVPRHSPDALLTLESQGLHVQATACNRACARPETRNTQPPSHPGLCSHPRLKGASGQLGIQTSSRCQTAPPQRLAAKLEQQPGALVVEVNGIEPMTSCLQSRRSPN